jgi:hypothetical protein
MSDTNVTKSFLSRAAAATKVEAGVNLSTAFKDAPASILAAIKKADAHLMFTHAQYEDNTGSGTGMLVIRPQSDSEVAYGQKVYSAAEMLEIGQLMMALHKADAIPEVHLDTDSSKHQEITLEFYLSSDE